MMRKVGAILPRPFLFPRTHWARLVTDHQPNISSPVASLTKRRLNHVPAKRPWPLDLKPTPSLAAFPEP